jgi:uncharacterized protein (TIGR02145 family)
MKKLFLQSIFSSVIMLTAAQSATTDEGVEINGITWATRNVGAPNTFVDNPEDLGNYYTWDAAQSVCPAGWCIPTKEELQTLLDESNVIKIWDDTKKGYTYTDAVSGESIFLPAAGLNTSKLDYVGESGYYWSSSEVGGSGYGLGFSKDFRGYVDIYSRGFGMSVRCVKENTPVTSLTNIKNEEIKIYTRPNTIIVENASGEVCIYNSTGLLIAGRAAARHGSTTIPVPTAGIYIVRVGNHIQKVIVP